LLRRAQILVIEGLHPFFDERVRDLLDFKIYLDISDDVKFAWKLQVGPPDTDEKYSQPASCTQLFPSRFPLAIECAAVSAARRCLCVLALQLGSGLFMMLTLTVQI